MLSVLQTTEIDLLDLFLSYLYVEIPASLKKDSSYLRHPMTRNDITDMIYAIC